jgi:hypothetical protein
MSAVKEQVLSQERIAERAYEIYLQRGGKEGHDVEDCDLLPVFGPVITKLPGFLVRLQRSK